MVQWVKNLRAEVQITVEALVQSPVHQSGLKDSALLQLQHKSQLKLRFDPWLGNFHMAWVQPLKINILKIKIKTSIYIAKTS